MPRSSSALNSLSLIFASLLRSSPLCKSSYWIFFTFIPLRPLKYNLSKLKLFVTSLKLAPLLFIPCRLVTSPFTQARHITASLPTFFFLPLSFNQVLLHLSQNNFPGQRGSPTPVCCASTEAVYVQVISDGFLPRMYLQSYILQSSASLKRMMSVYNLTSLMPPPQAS